MDAADGVLRHGDAGVLIHCKGADDLQVIRARGLVIQGTFLGALASLVCQTDLDLHHASRLLKVRAAGSDDVDAAWAVVFLTSLGHLWGRLVDVYSIGDGAISRGR